MAFIQILSVIKETRFRTVHNSRFMFAINHSLSFQFHTIPSVTGNSYFHRSSRRKLIVPRFRAAKSLGAS